MSDTLRVSNVYAGSAIGIGTTPSYALDVVGSINLTGSLLANGSTFTTSQWTTTGSNLYYNTGSVGIGTNAPSNRFHVYGSSSDWTSGMVAITNTNTAPVTSLTVLAPNMVTTSSVAMIIGQGATNNNGFVIQYNHNSAGSATNTFGIGAYGIGNQFTITAAGSVGIGTVSPSGMMHIYGTSTPTLVIGGASAANNSIQITYTQVSSGNSANYGSLQMNNVGSILNWTANSRVGIGKTNPAYALDVIGSVNVTGSFYVNGAAFSSGTSQWTTSGSIIYYNTGNVGIGITNPTIALTVYGSSSTTGISVINGASLATMDAAAGNATAPNMYELNAGDLHLKSYWGTSINMGFAGDSGDATKTRITGTTSFTINKIASNGTPTNLFAVRYNGYVGIGTTAPQGSLHVNMANQWPYGSVFSNAANANHQLVIGTYWTGTASTSYSAIQSVTQGVGNNILSLNPFAGNVGIGLTNPSAILHVNGAAIITGSLSVNGSAVPVSAGSVWATGSAGSISYGSGVVNITAGSKITVQNAVDGGTANGIYYWMNADTNWVGYMGQSGAGKSASGATACTGAFGFTAHALRNRVTNASTQGFIWENLAETCLMSIRGDGAGGGVIGSWGVDTVSPNAKFHVYGDGTSSVLAQLNEIKITGNGYSHWSIFGARSGHAYFSIANTSTNVAIGTAGTDVVCITSTNNVGIGTTSPITNLHVYQNTNGAVGQYIANPNAGSTAYSYMFLMNDSGGGGGLFLNSSTRTSDGSAETLTLRNDRGATRIQSGGGYGTANGITVANSTGAVGIGSSTPNYPLTVSGTSLIMEINRSGASTNYGSGVVHTLTSATGSFRGEYVRIYGGSDGAPATSAQSQANGYYCIDIANAGAFSASVNPANGAFFMTNSQATFNVPINIGGAMAGQGPFSIKTTNASYVSQYIQHAANGNWPIWIQFGTSGYTGSANFMLFQDASGNQRGSIASSAQNTISYNVGSDARIKHNIQDLTNVRSMIERFRPRRFELNNDPNNIEHHGFIAQEVLAEFPHLVTLETPESNIMMLDYGKFSPYGIAGVQDLYKENDALRSRVQSLETQVATQESRLTALEALLAKLAPLS
jgi:hypothetical protein